MFGVWRNTANQLDPGVEPDKAQPFSIRSVDGRTLRGYKLADSNTSAEAVVVIQGNAMTAATVADDLTPFSDAGLHVYLVDFRGYGKSEGVPRVSAFLSDYRQLLVQLRKTYDWVYVYGASIGAVIAANLLNTGLVDRTVLDSAPSTVQSFGCPKRLNPDANLPRDCSSILLISGGRDRVIKPAESAVLLDRAESCGARVIRREQWAHPFMDTAEVTASRLAEAAAFLKASRPESRQ